MTKLKCPTCGIEGDGKFCTKCGSALSQMVTKLKCPKCRIEGDGKFCTKCGSPLSQMATANAEMDERKKSATALTVRGLTHLRKGELDAAILDFDKAIEINPQDTMALDFKGNSLERQGKYDDALKYYNMSIEINPQKASPWFYKARTLAKQGNYDEALQVSDKAIEIDPKGFDVQIVKREIQKKERGNFDIDTIDKEALAKTENTKYETRVKLVDPKTMRMERQKKVPINSTQYYMLGLVEIVFGFAGLIGSVVMVLGIIGLFGILPALLVIGQGFKTIKNAHDGFKWVAIETWIDTNR